MAMKNVVQLLKNKNISFETREKAINWVKKLKCESLVRIGSSYFVDEKELHRLVDTFLLRQVNLKKSLKNQRALQAKKNFHTRKPAVRKPPAASQQ